MASAIDKHDFSTNAKIAASDKNLKMQLMRYYATRAEAKEDVFDYIEMFYNPKRRHGFNEKLSPVNFEKRYFERLASV